MIGRFTRSIVIARRYHGVLSLMEVSPAAKMDAKSLTIKESFINSLEQNSLMQEIELSLRRVKYSYDHWDDVSRVV